MSVHKLSVDGARVFYTDHARTRMRQRHVTQEIVLEVLRRGRLAGVPEPNAGRGSLECRMQRYCAGRQIGVIVAISDDDPDLIVVTVIEL